MERVLWLWARLWCICLWYSSRPILVRIWWIWLSPVSSTGKKTKKNLKAFAIFEYLLLFMVNKFSGRRYTRHYKLCGGWSCRARVIWSSGHSWCKQVNIHISFLHIPTYLVELLTDCLINCSLGYCRLNAGYLSVHASAILGRPMWQRTSSLTSQLGKWSRRERVERWVLWNVSFHFLMGLVTARRLIDLSVSDLSVICNWHLVTMLNHKI